VLVWTGKFAQTLVRTLAVKISEEQKEDPSEIANIDSFFSFS